MLDAIGWPRRSRFSENEESSGMFRDPPTGLADGLGLGLSFDARGADTPQLAWVPRIPRVARDLGQRECYHTGLHPQPHAHVQALRDSRTRSRRRLPLLRAVGRVA